MYIDDKKSLQTKLPNACLLSQLGPTQKAQPTPPAARAHRLPHRPHLPLPPPLPLGTNTII